MTTPAENTGLVQALDFRGECDALHAVLLAAPAAAWQRPTQFKQWTFDDVLGHLQMFDYAAELAARSRADIEAFLAELVVAQQRGTTLTAYTRRWLDGCSGADLLQRWHEQYIRLADVYLPLAADTRLAWVGPDMSARSFMSARQMETWSHGQAIFDALGFERVEHDRIRNIVVMGINTFGWTFTVNRREVPATRPYVRLVSPSGATWEWNDPAAVDRVEGSAVEFCRVVTQTRHVRDTGLQVTGPAAQAWMELAQCFAGPPERPPPPGTRFVQRIV
jgi:uncharacterized protein (TIGR03084 family)